MNDKYNIEDATTALLGLAYSILDYYKVPAGMEMNVEADAGDKKIHVMLEVVVDDD